MSDLFAEPNDATPLTPEEREGLIPTHVALRGELNELEQQNIIAAVAWAPRRRRDPLSIAFALALHRRMFSDVWRWAGHYRTSDKNIGIDRWEIEPRLRQLIDDTRYWIDHQTYPADEIAVRFHHALVYVHPFANGNGRWSRLMADILVATLGRPAFTWGRDDLRAVDDTRKEYIRALRAADRHDFAALLIFARS